MLSSMLGTVFFFLVQNSLANGVKSTIYIALGVISSDLLLIILSHFNSSLFPSGGQAEIWVRMGGAMFLLFLGISNIRKHTKLKYNTEIIRSPWMLASKGFMLNGLNPGNYFSWLSISAILTNVNHYTTAQLYWFYGGAMASIFGMEMLIAFGAVKIKRFVSEKLLHRIDVALGIVLIIFALVLLWPIVNELL